MKARSVILIIISIMIKAFALLDGHDHCFKVVVVVEELDGAEQEQLAVDSVAIVIEFHVDLVVGINAHAVDNVAVYGFRKFCETSVSLNTSVLALKRPLCEKIGFTGGC